MTTLLTVPQVAERLHCHPYKVRQLCATGQLRGSKPLGQWLIDPADLDTYLAAHTNQPAPPVALVRRRRRRHAA
jgi:excisionase family DNA binding protein